MQGSELFYLTNQLNICTVAFVVLVIELSIAILFEKKWIFIQFFSLNIELLSGHRGGFEDRRGGHDDGKQTSFSAF